MILKNYILTFCLAAISCAATKAVQQQDALANSSSTITSTIEIEAQQVISIMQHMKLL